MLFPRNFVCYRLIKRINLKVFFYNFARSLKLTFQKFCEMSIHTMSCCPSDMYIRSPESEF